MRQIYVNPIFDYPNFHAGRNTCHLSVTANTEDTRLLIVAAQRHGEWQTGTSAVNNAEVIAQRVMQEVLPALFQKQPVLRQAELLWVVEVITGDDIYSVRSLIDVTWSPTGSWFTRWRRPHDDTQRPTISFNNGLNPDDYAGLLAHGRSFYPSRQAVAGRA